jgi:hypothetical protein
MRIRFEWYHDRFKTKDEATFAIFSYIEVFYNPHRRHSSLGNLSPAEFERRLEQRKPQPALCSFAGVNRNGATPSEAQGLVNFRPAVVGQFHTGSDTDGDTPL